MPLYTINLIINQRMITIVFATFAEIKLLFQNYFIPLKFYQQKNQKKMFVTSVGKILWMRIRFIIQWKLGRKKILDSFPKNRKLTFVRLINLAKSHLFINS